MSYTIIRSFKATKENLYFNCGDNNIIPHIWSDCTQETNDKNIASLCEGLFHWEYHPYSGSKLADFQSKLCELRKQLKTVTSWEKDFYYDLNPGRDYQFDEYFAKTIGVALFKNYFFGDNYTYEDAKAYLLAFEKETARIYEEAERKQNEGNIIHTHCAIYSNIFAGHDILIDEHERLIIAKNENYDNHGHLNNNDNSAIILEGIESSSEHLYFLHDGSNFKNIADEVYQKIESILLEKDENLYNCFHILKLAKQQAMLSY